MLASDASVVLLDKEPQPGYHSTGRSAAYFSASYGSAAVRAATAASEPFFRSPPEGFTGTPLLRSRDTLFVARQNQLPRLSAFKEEISGLQEISGSDAILRVPILDADSVAAGILETGGRPRATGVVRMRRTRSPAGGGPSRLFFGPAPPKPSPPQRGAPRANTPGQDRTGDLQRVRLTS